MITGGAWVVVAVLGACGGDDGAPAIDASEIDGPDVDGAPDALEVDAAIDGAIDGAPATFTLTSTAIVAGGVIPDMYSCQGTNVSPPLAWTGAPSAPGFAMVFTDVTNTANPFLHSIIWDIPGSATSLPENIAKVYMPPDPAGSKQPLGYNGQTRGYLGPCPGSMHRYEYVLVAVDAYPLPGLDMQSTRFVVRDTINAHATARATLAATFTP